MSGFDIVGLGLEKGLSATELQQKVISNNIANISTPQFKRGLVSFHSALESAMKTRDMKTVEASQASITIDNSTTGKLDGNNVDINVEMVDLSKNQLMNQAFVNLIRERAQQMRTAMGR